MKRFELIVLAIVLIGLSCARTAVRDPGPVSSVLALSNAAPATQPAAEEKPALPTGHPDISQMTTGGANGTPASGLPAGHPSLPAQPAQPAKTFETTTQEPDWFIQMRHIMVTPTDKGLAVADMLAVQNPIEKGWAGKNNVTFEVALPMGATDVQFTAGFDDKARVEGNKVINPSPLPPGTTKYRIEYVLPLSNGRAELTATAPAPVSTMMIFYPDDGAAILATGLKGPETIDMGKGNMRYFKADDIGPGHQVKLNIGGVSATPAVKSSAAEPMDSPVGEPIAAVATASTGAELAKAVAGVGAVLIFLLGGALMLIKPKSAKKR